ncbi:hypothetical protein BN1013_01663 [Candidatus Rubidus massiliensis]|nr:hypothetical protein BN1013_01663 [Candidatus Rubidus massiliensis]
MCNKKMRIKKFGFKLIILAIAFSLYAFFFVSKNEQETFYMTSWVILSMSLFCFSKSWQNKKTHSVSFKNK